MGGFRVTHKGVKKVPIWRYIHNKLRRFKFQITLQQS
jgi:hypothetical protein